MPELSPVETYFDSPFRSSIEDVNRRKEMITGNEMFMALISGIPNLAVLLDENRQIVAYNEQALKHFSSFGPFEIFGMRLGEALNCIHSNEPPARCGTTKFCTECGAARAIKTTGDTKEKAVEECRITVKKNQHEDCLDLRVHTSPFSVDGEQFTLFTIEDIAGEKRKEALERIFFHDVLNTAGAVGGLVSILPETESKEEESEIVKLLGNASEQLIEEIKSQRDLVKAETGEIIVQPLPQSMNELIEHVSLVYQRSPYAEKKKIMTELMSTDLTVVTDRVQIIRTLSNLVKNALEASLPGDAVVLSAEVKEQTAVFSVKNKGVIPAPIQLQIFQRSFSTKGEKGRGIGTYSIKLLVERYMRGKVSFISDEEHDTVFSIAVPLEYSAGSK